VREIHPGDVHAVLDELEEDLGTAAGRPDGAHNSGQTHPKHNHTNKNNSDMYSTVRVLIIIISVADPDPGSGAFLDPGSRMQDGLKKRYPDPGSGSGMKIPDHISESLETIFGSKKTSRISNTENNLGDIFFVHYRNLKALLSRFEGSEVLRIKH
jgi:hypothetical protein